MDNNMQVAPCCTHWAKIKSMLSVGESRRSNLHLLLPPTRTPPVTRTLRLPLRLLLLLHHALATTRAVHPRRPSRPLFHTSHTVPSGHRCVIHLGLRTKPKHGRHVSSLRVRHMQQHNSLVTLSVPMQAVHPVPKHSITPIPVLDHDWEVCDGFEGLPTSGRLPGDSSGRGASPFPRSFVADDD